MHARIEFSIDATAQHGRTARRACTVIAVALLAACGSGGTTTTAPAVAQSPQLSGLGSVAFDQDTSSPPQVFKLSDADTPLAQLEIGITTSDPALLPLAGIVMRGDGPERTITYTPAPEAIGTADVTVTARDPGGLTASTTVAVQVKPVLVSFRALANGSFATSVSGDAAKVSGVTVQPDADDDPTAFDALLQ